MPKCNSKEIDKTKAVIPIIDCPICGGKDVPVSHIATMTKGKKEIEIWECSACGKVPNIATEVKVKKYISVQELKELGYKEEANDKQM